MKNISVQDVRNSFTKLIFKKLWNRVKEEKVNQVGTHVWNRVHTIVDNQIWVFFQNGGLR